MSSKRSDQAKKQKLERTAESTQEGKSSIQVPSAILGVSLTHSKLILSYCSLNDLARLSACSTLLLARSSGEISRRLLKADLHYDWQFPTDRQLRRVMPRVNDEDIDSQKHRMLHVFKPVDGDERVATGFFGGMPELFFEPGTGQAKLLPPFSIHNWRDRERYHYPSQQISSPLALYRIISLFHCDVDLGDGYKTNWGVDLRHRTGGRLRLYEWKGSFSVGVDTPESPSACDSFQRDVEELLTLLASPRMTIGYDGTVAGACA